MKLSLFAFCCLTLAAQTPPGRVEFEVASVKPSAPAAPAQLSVGIHIDGAQVRCTYLSLKDYVRIAYRLKDYQITGPDWIASERFDIAAKLPDGGAREQVAQMLQSLLEERFALKTHRETKELPVYGLVVAKSGLKMQRTPGTGDENAPRTAVNVTASGSAGGIAINYGQGSSFTMGADGIEGRKLPAAGIADTFARFVDRPVVDMTGLKGYYDFSIPLTPEEFRALMIRSAITAGVALPPQALQYAESLPNDSLFSAVQTLGLKLDPRKAPLEVLVVDHARRTPAEN